MINLRFQKMESISADEIDQMHANLMKEANRMLVELETKVAKQRSSEEQRRLQKIQNDMQVERNRKLDEESRKKEAENLKQQ